MPSHIKTIASLLLAAFLLMACNIRPTATAIPIPPSQTSTSTKTTQPTASPTRKATPPAEPTGTKTPYPPTPTPAPTANLDPVLIDSLGKGEMPLLIERSPDGNLIFLTKWDYDTFAQLQVLNAITKEELRVFDLGFYGGGITAYSPDGRLIAIDAGGEIKVIDLSNNQIIASAQTPENGSAIYSVTFSPNSRYLVYQDRTTANWFDPEIIQVWDIEKDQHVYLIPGVNPDYGPDDYPWWQEYNQNLVVPANSENPFSRISNPVI